MMLRGRNPSPPGDYEDFDYMSSANSRVLFLKPTWSMPHKTFPALNYFKEALMRSKLVARVLSKKNSEAKPLSESPEVKNDVQEKVFEDSEENSTDHMSLPSYEPVEQSEIPVLISHRRPEIKIMPDSKIKKEIDTQKLLSDMSLTEVCQEDEFSKALSKDIELRSKLHDRKEEFMGPDFRSKLHDRKEEFMGPDLRCKLQDRKEEFMGPDLRSKLHDRKEEFMGPDLRSKLHDRKEELVGFDLRSKLQDRKEEFGPEFPKHCSRKNREDEYLSDSPPRNKTHERKEDSSEYRKHKSLRRKRDEDYLGGYDYRRCKSRSSRSRQGNYSSDESEFSYRSFRSHKRSKSKESVISRKRSDRKSSRRHSDSDSDASVKVISSKARRETTSKTKKAPMDGDSDKESHSKKVTKSEEKEKPKKKADSPDQVMLSPKSVQHDPVVNEDYFDESELTAGVFGGSETYYCKVCQLNLNGIACYETHMNGKKHKKALNAQLLRPEALLFQVIGNHSKDPSFMQALNRNVKMTKSDERAKFQNTIDLYHDNPLPGLNYIDEIHAKDGINYYCELCEAPCMPASILPHLLGFKHYMNFMKIIEPSYYERNKDRAKKEIERQVKTKLRDHERKFGRKEMTVVRCQVDSRGFPTDDPGPSHRLPFREEIDLTNCAVVDDYGDFYCKICDAHMNNESMFHAHMVGKRHLKNEKKYSAGQETSPSSSGTVRAPPNVPSELERMLLDVIDIPVVGLNFMRETRNRNGEYYTCFICGCCATTVDVIDHIISMKHRIKYLETVNENKSIPNSIGNIRELEVSTQIREGLVSDVCREIEAMHGRGRVEVYI